jgi:hypothetical protein
MNFLRSPELGTVAGEAVFRLPVSYARGQERDVSGIPDDSGATHGLRRGRGIHRGDSRHFAAVRAGPRAELAGR